MITVTHNSIISLCPVTLWTVFSSVCSPIHSFHTNNTQWLAVIIDSSGAASSGSGPLEITLQVLCCFLYLYIKALQFKFQHDSYNITLPKNNTFNYYCLFEFPHQWQFFITNNFPQVFYDSKYFFADDFSNKPQACYTLTVLN